MERITLGSIEYFGVCAFWQSSSPFAPMMMWKFLRGLLYCVIFATQAVGEGLFTASGSIASVDLALKSVVRGGIVFAAKSIDGITVWYEDASILSDSDEDAVQCSNKIVQLTDSLFAIGCGFVSDVQYIMNYLINDYIHAVDIKGTVDSTRRVASSIAKIIFERSLSKYLRSFGTSIVLGGIDKNRAVELIEIDPYGIERDCRVSCNGRNSPEVLKRWKLLMSTDNNHKDCAKLQYNLNNSELSEKMLSCIMQVFLNSDEEIQVSSEQKREFVSNRHLRKFQLAHKIIDHQ